VRAFAPVLPLIDRKLYVFFEAGRTRYALEATAVTEVAHPNPGDDSLHGHHALRDLSQLLGGSDEVRPGAAVILDTSPTVAVRVREVGGVFDTSSDLFLSLPGRMIPLVAPAIRGALLHEGELVFELDREGAARGLPRQLKKPVLATLAPTTPCLVFDTGPLRLAVPLPRVLQVVPVGPAFNRAPGEGAFCGAVAHLQQLCPVFRVSDATGEPFIVLVEARGELMGLTAARADGVKQADSLGEVPVLDLEQMFS
jgi:chemotaxis signal transduction protein